MRGLPSHITSIPFRIGAEGEYITAVMIGRTCESSAISGSAAVSGRAMRTAAQRVPILVQDAAAVVVDTAGKVLHVKVQRRQPVVEPEALLLPQLLPQLAAKAVVTALQRSAAAFSITPSPPQHLGRPTASRRRVLRRGDSQQIRENSQQIWGDEITHIPALA